MLCHNIIYFTSYLESVSIPKKFVILILVIFSGVACLCTSHLDIFIFTVLSRISPSVVYSVLETNIFRKSFLLRAVDVINVEMKTKNVKKRKKTWIKFKKNVCKRIKNVADICRESNYYLCTLSHT